MKPAKQSKTIKSAKIYQWVGWGVIGAAGIPFMLDNLDMLNLSPALYGWAKFLLGTASACIVAGKQFEYHRLRTSEPVYKPPK